MRTKIWLLLLAVLSGAMGQPVFDVMETTVAEIHAGYASGTLTAFAFDGGQAISEHTTSHEAFALGLEGTVEFTVGGAVHLLTEGDLLRLPAGVPHGLRAQSRAKMLLVMFKV